MLGAYALILALADCHPGEQAGSPTPVATDVTEHSLAQPHDAGSLLSMAPVLDENHGSRAARDYEDFRRNFCNSMAKARSAPPELLEREGLPRGGNPMRLCNNAQSEAIASGSFFEALADEVLVEVPNGEAAAFGDRTLALMRMNGGHYHLIRHLLASQRFTAPFRALVPGHVDVLMLCGRSGNMGLYPSTCGFLGEGTFRPDATEADDRFAAANEIQLVAVSVCGPQTWVELGSVRLEGDRIAAPLVVVRARLAAKEPDETHDCSTQLGRRETVFSIDFEVTGQDMAGHGKGRVRRVTPVPREVSSVLERY